MVGLGGLEPPTSPLSGQLGFTTYKTAGTAKIRGSRTRHRSLWVGLWVAKSPRFCGNPHCSFPVSSFIRKDHSEAAVWKTAAVLP